LSLPPQGFPDPNTDLGQMLSHLRGKIRRRIRDE
jgi:hypothetical protein